MRSSGSSSLARLLKHLSFGLDEIKRVNATFQRWQAHRNPQDKRDVDLWTYCYVRRYFLHKFTRATDHATTDFDSLVDRTFRKISGKLSTIERADRYAHWVSVVCKNTYLNYLKRRQSHLSIDEDGGPTLVAPPDVALHDAGLVLEALASAIDRLPSYLQEVARLRFLEDCPYEEISAELDKPLPTVRTYAHRALQSFREDALLRSYWLESEKNDT